MSLSTTLNPNGEITIPLAILREVGLKTGDWVVLERTGNGVTMRKRDVVSDPLHERGN